MLAWVRRARTGRPLLLACAALGATAFPSHALSIVRSWPVDPPGTTFAGGGEYDSARDVVWIVDETNDLITTYSCTGVFLNQWPAPIPPGSTIAASQPIGAGVDPATGNAWIGDEGEWVYEFDPIPDCRPASPGRQRRRSPTCPAARWIPAPAT